MRKLIGLVGLAAAALLTACGGGGGSPGDTQERYSITLRADKTSLPVNVAREWPYLNGYAGSGASAFYTTTLYVQAKEGNDNILGGEEIFECDVKGGLDTGVLMYMDGDEDHYEEIDLPDGSKVRVEKSYRSIVLGANSGGNSFHFHALDQAGAARITCSVTDPRDSRVYSASVDITVGGGAGTGKPASVVATVQEPRYLGSQFNVNDIANNVVVQAAVKDDVIQPVPNPGAPNVQVRILPTSASGGARLLLGDQGGSVVQATTSGGVATFSLSSGPNRGVILLELTADRHDNNVANGIQDAIVQWAAVPVVDGISASPVMFDSVEITMPNATAFGQALEAAGGTPPYTWVALGPLPTGLSLSPSGVISGTPKVAPGSYAVRVRVTDVFGVFAEGVVTITIEGPIYPELAMVAASGSATEGLQFSYALTATGGLKPYTWTALAGMPPGLQLSSAGVISGVPTMPGNYTIAVRVSDSDGNSVTGNITLSVADPVPTP